MRSDHEVLVRQSETIEVLRIAFNKIESEDAHRYRDGDWLVFPTPFSVMTPIIVMNDALWEK